MPDSSHRFELPSVPSFMEGVYLGVNAVKDAYLLVNCPQGCFYRCEKISVNHDAYSTLYDPLGCHRIIQSGITYTELAMGTEETLFDLVKKVVERVHPPALFFTQVSMTLVTSFDVDAFASEVEKRFSLPLLYIPPASFEGDFLDGFEAFIDKLVDAVMMISNAGMELNSSVMVSGYFADRLEEDHIANVGEIARLVQAAGVSCSGVCLSGAPLEELARVFSASLIVNLPYAVDSGNKIASMTGARVIDLDLPVGIEGTIGWIRALARAAGTDAEQFINSELRRVIPKIDAARRRFLLNRSVAIASDPYLARALALFASELGMDVPLIAVKTRHGEKSDAVRRAVEQAGLRSRVIHDYSSSEFSEQVAELTRDSRCDVIIGADTELNAAFDAGAGFVGIGYPLFYSHSFYPRPFIGFSGALRLANDLANAVQQRDFISGRRKG